VPKCGLGIIRDRGQAYAGGLSPLFTVHDGENEIKFAGRPSRPLGYTTVERR
jgi:hypothetical protein